MGPESFTIRTSRGPRRLTEEAGYVLPHEHVVIDIRVWWEGDGDWRGLDDDPPHVLPDPAAVAARPQAVARENLVLSDWYLSAKELQLAARDGCQLVVDLTTEGLDPQHRLAVKAAELAGVELVLGVGRYLAETFGEADLSASVEELVDTWLLQIDEGIDGLLPGIIGEIGTGETIRPAEENSLRAAARVHGQSALPINVHVHPYARQALKAINILDSEGADLSKVAISHCDGELDLDWLTGLLKTGVYIELDNFGTSTSRLVQGRGYPSDDERVQAILALHDAGYGDRLLLSHDICHRNSLTRHGGWGYAHIGRNVRPKLVSSLGEAATASLLSTNPLTFLNVPSGALLPADPATS